jgi:hypothetical protein
VCERTRRANRKKINKNAARSHHYLVHQVSGEIYCYVYIVGGLMGKWSNKHSLLFVSVGKII